ncbi:MAG TPA: bifunctional DNA-formamidopyrimidine glycosylase/DNA-(apurinic or apyrimidinic site) lyase [Tepidisphaeraceae bacterium]|jgi:formamidopyrimidine-DNA glycosylase
MPELPEVQTVVDTISPFVTGKRIKNIDLFRDDIVTPIDIDLPQLLRGRTIKKIWRRAKRIMFELDNANSFYIHLGMSGQLKIASADKPIIKHTHLIIHLDKQQLRFRDPRRFGGVFWLGHNHADDPNLGPEPLDISAPELQTRLSKTRRAIKVALMDQSLIAGLGNIYADEALFDSGIDPRRPANKLSPEQIKKLTHSIKAVLRAAIEHRGSTLRDYTDAKGRKGKFQKQHRVYHRTGQACVTCGGKIQKIILGGRSTHFCKKCQPRHGAGPSPARNSSTKSV